MRGGGSYSAVTRGPKDAIDGAIPLGLAAIRRLPEAGASRLFTLAEIGRAAGGTSRDLVRQAILGVRPRWPRRPTQSHRDSSVLRHEAARNPPAIIRDVRCSLRWNRS
jgi:hypothetical protein